MDFKKFLSGANTALSRVVQMTEETIGHSDRTPYDEYYLQLARRFETTQMWTEKLIAGTETWLEPNPANRVENLVFDKLEREQSNRNNPSEQMAETLINAGADIGVTTDYGCGLAKYGQYQQRVGKAEREFQQTVAATFLKPLKTFLEVDCKAIQKERKDLDNVRLDLDAARSKSRRVKNGAEDAVLKAQNEQDQAQQRFDDQMTSVKLLLEGVQASHTHHLESLGEMIEAQKALYAQCHQIMVDLQTAITASK